jgi:hypothetical protein
LDFEVFFTVSAEFSKLAGKNKKIEGKGTAARTAWYEVYNVISAILDAAFVEPLFAHNTLAQIQ